MSIVSRPASQAYRDNFPFPDRRVAVIDNPGEPVVGMVRIEGAPIEGRNPVLTDRQDFIEKVFLRGESLEDILAGFDWHLWTGNTLANAQATVKAYGGDVYAVELRIKKVD